MIRKGPTFAAIAAPTAMAATVAALLLPPRPARAEIAWDLLPTAGAGVTENARRTSTGVRRVRDEFGTAGLTGRLRYQGARTSLVLSNRVSGTHFFENRGVDTLNDEAALMFARPLSAFVDLRVTANGAIARLSGVNTGDLTAFMPEVEPGGTNVFYTAGAIEELSYQPSPRRRYAEALTVTRLAYLTEMSPYPDSTLVAARLQSDWNGAIDRFFVHGDTSFTKVGARAGATAGTKAPVFGQGDILMTQVLGGWRRELTAAWTVEAQAGPLMLWKPEGPYVMTHTEIVSAIYQRAPWFAALSIGEVPSVNLRLGNATVNAQVLLRLAMPLDRRELVFIGGYGGYIYARAATDKLQLTKAFDQLTAGGSLTARMMRHPYWASLSYNVVTQRGSSPGEGQTGSEIPDLARSTLMLTVGGAFAGDPREVSLFSGTP